MWLPFPFTMIASSLLSSAIPISIFEILAPIVGIVVFKTCSAVLTISNTCSYDSGIWQMLSIACQLSNWHCAADDMLSLVPQSYLTSHTMQRHTQRYATTTSTLMRRRNAHQISLLPQNTWIALMGFCQANLLEKSKVFVHLLQVTQTDKTDSLSRSSQSNIE